MPGPGYRLQLAPQLVHKAVGTRIWMVHERSLYLADERRGPEAIVREHGAIVDQAALDPLMRRRKRRRQVLAGYATCHRRSPINDCSSDACPSPFGRWA